MTTDVQTGVAAGVPYVLRAPAGRRVDAPVVLAWHLMDAPRTEAAFAAALPLEGLDAWRIYFGLPLCGSRSPGDEEVMRRAFAEPVLQMHDPVNADAVAELPAAFAAVRAEHGIGDGPVGVLGGSAGAGVAGGVALAGDVPVRAAVLVSPLVQLRPAVAYLGRLFGRPYEWTPESDAVADRMDLVARADELGDLPVRAIVGEEDDADAFLHPAQALAKALPAGEVLTVPGMGHALAEEPGLEPAPQTPHAAEVDAHAVAWFRQHLGS
jgi:pimeloyl-ACP methyl ester carboxylesterase